METIKSLLHYVFEFGGYPMVNITNVKEALDISECDRIAITKHSKLTKQFNSCVKSGKFLTILH